MGEKGKGGRLDVSFCNSWEELSEELHSGRSAEAVGRPKGICTGLSRAIGASLISSIFLS
jgi:hypothetical protein